MRIDAILLAAALFGAPLHSQTDSAQTTSNVAGFKIGETLVYEAKFGFLTLGSGMMHVAGIDTVRGVPSLHVIFVLKGGGFMYPMHDRMDSWIGIDDFVSRRFVQDFHEGSSHRYTAWDIYPDSGYYREEGADSTIATSPDPLDDYAFFYFARTLDYEVGQTYEFDRYFRPDRNPVVLDVLEKDTLDLPAGRFPSVVVHPVIQGRGILAEGKEARMWISDDESRLMIQLKVKFSFATITLRLKSIVDSPPEDMLLRPTETEGSHENGSP
jgi:hypothetical protein